MIVQALIFFPVDHLQGPHRYSGYSKHWQIDRSDLIGHFEIGRDFDSETSSDLGLEALLATDDGQCVLYANGPCKSVLDHQTLQPPLQRFDNNGHITTIGNSDGHESVHLCAFCIRSLRNVCPLVSQRNPLNSGVVDVG